MNHPSYATPNGGCILTMRSQSNASRGKQILRKYGISSELVSIDPSLTRHGCAFGLEICGACSAALEHLTAHRVSYGDILGSYGG